MSCHVDSLPDAVTSDEDDRTPEQCTSETEDSLERHVGSCAEALAAFKGKADSGHQPCASSWNDCGSALNYELLSTKRCTIKRGRRPAATFPARSALKSSPVAWIDDATTATTTTTLNSAGGSHLFVNAGTVRRCAQCGATVTPLWRSGPAGPKSLCNACGVRYKKRLHHTGSDIDAKLAMDASSLPSLHRTSVDVATGAGAPPWTGAERTPALPVALRSGSGSSVNIQPPRSAAAQGRRQRTRPVRSRAPFAPCVERMTPPCSAPGATNALGIAAAANANPIPLERTVPREANTKTPASWHLLFDPDDRAVFGYYCAAHDAALTSLPYAPSDTEWARRHYFVERPSP